MPDTSGKTITVVASTGAGGPLDLIARTIARHMARHVPGTPAMIVRNMPGGGHVLATNFMFNQAAKDGTVIATVVNSIPLHQVIDGRGVRYDARKFSWIGATGTSNLMTVAWHTAGVRTIADVMQRELPTGATGVGSGTFMYTNAMNVVLGTKFKMVLGYASSTDIDLAMERGEVEGVCMASSTLTGPRSDLIEKGAIRILFSMEAKPMAAFPNVPTMFARLKTVEQRQIVSFINAALEYGRPFAAPPGVPPERLAALQAAFRAMLDDADFLAEAKQLKYQITYTSPQEMKELTERMYATPPAIVSEAAAMMPSD